MKIDRLDYYVYILYRSNGTALYVGKGRGDRCLDHRRSALKGQCHNKHLEAVICNTIKEGKEIVIVKVLENLSNKEAIFHEEDTDDMMKVVAMFDRGGDATELENVLELVTDAWNYFPHKVLGDISPAEKLNRR